MRRRCQACGDPLPREAISVANVPKEKMAELRKASLTYCDECAAEKVLGRVVPGTTIHGTGGGQRVIRDPRGL